MMQATDGAVQSQIDRILHSDTFRNADALRKLLRFLAEKLAQGEADQIKEYSIGIDVLGKPSTYDPRNDATVRIQVSRLRQKLAEYYAVEGKDDAYILQLPKGRFRLICEPRPAVEAPPAAQQVERESNVWKPAALALGVALLVTLSWAIFSYVARREPAAS